MLHCSATALHTAHLLAPQLDPFQQREGGGLQGRALVTLAFRTLSPWVLQLLNCSHGKVQASVQAHPKQMVMQLCITLVNELKARPFQHRLVHKGTTASAFSGSAAAEPRVHERTIEGLALRCGKV